MSYINIDELACKSYLFQLLIMTLVQAVLLGCSWLVIGDSLYQQRQYITQTILSKHDELLLLKVQLNTYPQQAELQARLTDWQEKTQPLSTTISDNEPLIARLSILIDQHHLTLHHFYPHEVSRDTEQNTNIIKLQIKGQYQKLLAFFKVLVSQINLDVIAINIKNSNDNQKVDAFSVRQDDLIMSLSLSASLIVLNK